MEDILFHLLPMMLSGLKTGSCCPVIILLSRKKASNADSNTSAASSTLLILLPATSIMALRILNENRNRNPCYFELKILYLEIRACRAS